MQKITGGIQWVFILIDSQRIVELEENGVEAAAVPVVGDAAAVVALAGEVAQRHELNILSQIKEKVTLGTLSKYQYFLASAVLCCFKKAPFIIYCKFNKNHRTQRKNHMTGCVVYLCNNNSVYV